VWRGVREIFTSFLNKGEVEGSLRQQGAGGLGKKRVAQLSSVEYRPKKAMVSREVNGEGRRRGGCAGQLGLKG